MGTQAGGSEEIELNEGQVFPVNGSGTLIAAESRGRDHCFGDLVAVKVPLAWPP
jgi:hypothetical protein